MPSPSVSIQQQVSLAPYTTFRIGGPARFFCEVSSEAELLEAVRFARRQNLRIFVLGGGSNLLVSDAGFDGLVIHIAIRQPTRITSSEDSTEYVAAAGIDWNDFVLAVCEQGLSGVECLAGIPGYIGGTPVQNVGAYGQEVAETITEVRAFDLWALSALSNLSAPSNRSAVQSQEAPHEPEAIAFVTLPKDQCGFSYRHSIFNSTERNRYIVTEVTFQFDRTARPNLIYADLARHFAQPGQPAHPTPLDVYHVVRDIRRAKGMLLVEGEPDSRSAGSFFKNPIVPAAALA
ncbi:MAG: FAD-binding protein, partial [Acidobacteriota bacterium]|nr:FAD-binding protein [Acidobacteriota bacterium]